jgi:hypothetical protein
MQPKKEMLLLFVLILLSTGIIISAEVPSGKKMPGRPAKCCKMASPSPSAAPLNTITEGILKGRA